MSVHLVTGYAGEAHVSSIDHGILNTMIFGSSTFVLPYGQKFAISILQEDEAQVRFQIADGDMMMQGRHVRIARGDSKKVVMAKASQGYQRVSLIVMRYTKDAASGVEACNIVVLDGEEQDFGTSYIEPDYTIGDLTDAGCVLNEFPLYSVEISERDIVKITQLFTVKNPLNNINSATVQSGTATIEYSATHTTTVDVKFPVKFATAPVVMVSQVFNETNIVVRQEDITTTGFTAKLVAVGSSGYRDFSWLAIAT